jgi:hypothetical protein
VIFLPYPHVLLRRAAQWFVQTPAGLALLEQLATADEEISRNLLETLARLHRARLEFWE